MITSAQLPQDHPLMRAWAEHKATTEYANSRAWVDHAQHAEGSMWALFVAGWMAAQRYRMAEEVNPDSDAQ